MCKKGLHWLWCNLEETINIVLLAMLAILVFLQVVMRYVVGSALQWSEEATRYIFVWMTMIGFSLGVKHRKHVRMQIVYDRFGKNGQFVMELAANIIFLIFCLLNIVLGIKLVASFMEFQQVSPALNIPMQYIYLSAPLCMAVTAIRILQNMWADVKAFCQPAEAKEG